MVRRAAGVVALAVLAASCGNGGDDDTAAPGSTAARAASSTSAPKVVTTSAEGQPTSMEEWEALWAEERAEVIARIEENGWGVSADGKTLTGPEGFTIDLSQCPSGWSPTEGLTDTEIKIGHTIPLSGSAADYGNSTKTNAAVFKRLSDEGFFTDSTGKKRTINYIVKDDGYDPARTIPLTDELIDSERTFMHWALGTAPLLRIYGKLNDRCIPMPFVQSGHPAFGDPVNHPWTIGAPQLTYTTEAALWGKFIDDRFDEVAGDDGKVKVAALVQDNDFGRVYDAGFRDYLETSPNKDRIEYVSETVETQAPSLTDPMTTLAAEKPDMFIAMVAAGVCTQTAIAASENGMHDDVGFLFQPAVCTGTVYVSKEKVGGDGSATDGWWLISPGMKDVNDPTQADDPYIQWAHDVFDEAGIDPKQSSSYGTGFQFNWALTQALKIGGDLPGGLTRPNFILAARAMDMTHPFFHDGIAFNLDGNKDAYAVEGGVLEQWNAADQVWEVRGDVLDLSGQSGNCAWDLNTCVCA